MADKDLKNKPLVEAILELRWGLVGTPVPGLLSDPNFRLLLGRFQERVQNQFPFYEPLGNAQMPDEFMAYNVQHRFRSAKDAWPLIQLGPGIMSLNVTSSYQWPEFKKQSDLAVSWLFDAHPARHELVVKNLILRYIDAIEVNHQEENITTFLADKLKMEIKIPDALFDKSDVSPIPAAFLWQTSFKLKEPPGLVTLKFAQGNKKDNPALIWETVVQAKNEEIPEMPSQFSDWLEGAHKITHSWFFKLIEGELEREFSGD